MTYKRLLREVTRRPLRFGDDNAFVIAWRALLIRKGYVVKPAGEFDKPLLAATKHSQIWAKVDADGLVGPITLKAVRAKRRRLRPWRYIRNAFRPKIVDVRNTFPRNPNRSWSRRRLVQLAGICGHYTGNNASFLADAKFHVYTDYLTEGGAPAIAYTLGVNKRGTIFVFNDLEDVTWHCNANQNTLWVGVVFQGGTEGPNLAQRRSLRWLYRQLDRQGGGAMYKYGFHSIPSGRTVHRRVKPTSCPGDKGEAFYRSLVK